MNGMNEMKKYVTLGAVAGALASVFIIVMEWLFGGPGLFFALFTLIGVIVGGLIGIIKQ